MRHIKVTLLFTYSGIDNKDIEPYPSHVAAESMRLMSATTPRRYRTVLYWRPLVPGLNDTSEHLQRAYELSRLADATVFTGLFYRDQIAEYYRASKLPEPYGETARRKIVPETLEKRVLSAFGGSDSLFRKTSCAVSYAHGEPDYNGHYGIRELCDICPLGQLDRCKEAHRVPSAGRIREVADALPEAAGLVVVDITDRAAVVSGLTVILEADPEVIADRLRARGPHNRFQRTPGSSRAEARFYRQATERLAEAGFEVLRVDCNRRPPEQSAEIIRDRLETLLAPPGAGTPP
ncbi:hypothetical protein ACIRQP_20180 [Streptomyces sp. NPDC102274]|uniref:hypothetical protein n=1 Tax=Streptomyces sp. NPDC102274 TaxID=3366151 RepID=UPI0038278743